MERHEQRVVRFLSQPSAYPHPSGPVDHRETHVSHVFLAGDFAYKLKKPVRFPFLDASTLALRKRFCLLELSLNRRLAPTIYLGIMPVVETSAGLRLGGRGRVIEWLVKMRRLPEGRMLDQLVARRRVTSSDMDRLMARLVPFFRRAARSAAIDRYGRPDAVAELVLGNLRECQPFVESHGHTRGTESRAKGSGSARNPSRGIGTLLHETDRAFLDAAYRQFLALHEPLLARRVREHRIIDGHGDLRCENICMWSPSAMLRGEILSKAKGRVEGTNDVSIFDCVEFQPAFRCGDLVNDFSFLVMDLEFRGQDTLARRLIGDYQRTLRDSTFPTMLPLYECHRSLVRGKVRGFAWLQHPDTAEGRRIRTLSRRHFQRAVRYARVFAPPRLVVIGGLIGSGKSTLAESLSQALGAVWLRSDEIRLTEFAHTRQRRGRGEGFAEGLYAPRISERVYQRIMQRTRNALRRGSSVVCDGTFSKAEGRETLRRIAAQSVASFHFIECVIPRAVALRRIAARLAAQRDISEARPEHYDRLKAGVEPVHGWSAREWTRLSDNRQPEATFRAALDTLRRAWQIPR